MDQNISIDINVTKLLDWLISRRHCQKDWQIEIAKVRNKINAGLETLPEHKAIAELLSGSFLTYYHFLKLVKILQETEGDKKNIFGLNNSKIMKDWNEIISLYQKNNLYLAEAADFIIAMNKYDLPNLKKQITKQKQLENDLKKKEVETQKAGVTLKNELTHLLKELGLKENESSYKAGLIESAKGLTKTHENIADQTKSLIRIIQHYKQFAKTTQPNIEIDMSLIDYMAEKGNTTMFEYSKGFKPSKVILPTIEVADEETDATSDTIDWGFPTEEPEKVDEDVQEPVEESEDVAVGELALSLLDEYKTRTGFINLLLELGAFLKLRIYESQLEGALDGLVESKSSLQEMLVLVEGILDILNSQTVQHQYYLTHHPRYLEDILKKITQKKSGIERSATVIEVLRERAKDAVSEAQSLNVKVKALTQQCLQLQDQIAADISKKYNGRDVFLIGGV